MTVPRRKYRDLYPKPEPTPQPFSTPIPLPDMACNPQNMAKLAGAQNLLAEVVRRLTERVEVLEKREAA